MIASREDTESDGIVHQDEQDRESDSDGGVDEQIAEGNIGAAALNCHDDSEIQSGDS